ncbi:MAG: signal peptidase I [Ktedonobacteraceae bacterium]|nr:signal peptidase I [Ktedonobacteraceae bacterium]
MFLVIRLAVQNFNVDGMSMEPNLHNQELVLVDKWTYHFHTPARGDVVVFVAPPNPTQDYIKRIIGVPGDIITIQDTTVMVNGKALQEPYIDPRRQGNPYGAIVNRVVPPGTYFVLGDNRAGSSDSRDWGCVPAANIIGRAALVYWPLGQDNNGFIPNVSSTFKDIPAPPAVKNTNTCPVVKSPPRASSISSTNSTLLLQANMSLAFIPPGLLALYMRRVRRHIR